MLKFISYIQESQIEDLITELCEKLREIEKQTKIDNENEFSKQPTSATTKKVISISYSLNFKLV